MMLLFFLFGVLILNLLRVISYFKLRVVSLFVPNVGAVNYSIEEVKELPNTDETDNRVADDQDVVRCHPGIFRVE